MSNLFKKVCKNTVQCTLQCNVDYVCRFKCLLKVPEPYCTREEGVWIEIGSVSYACLLCVSYSGIGLNVGPILDDRLKEKS